MDFRHGPIGKADLVGEILTKQYIAFLFILSNMITNFIAV